MLRNNRGRRRYTVSRSFKSSNQFMGQAIPGEGDFELTGERTEPVAQMSLFGDYLWPLAVSFTIAVLASILSFFVARELGYKLTFQQAMIGFFGIWLLGFLLTVFGVVISLKWVKEKIDEFLPEAEPAPVIELTVNVKDKHDKIATMLRPHFQVTPHQLVEFASGVIHTEKGLTVKTWVDDEKLFTRPEFDTFMAECEKAKLVERKGSAANSPRILTTWGKQALSEVWENRLDILDV